MSRPHLLRVEYDDGTWFVRVECPYDDDGAMRPCAVWDDEDGHKRQDACTFQHYAVEASLEEWLRGPIEFGPMPIWAGGSGDNWFATTDSGWPGGESGVGAKVSGDG